MQRRGFLKGAAVLGAGTAVGWPGLGVAAAGWRQFEVTYRVTLTEAAKPARLWVPLPQDALDYQRVFDVTWRAPVPARVHWDETYRAPIFQAEWADATAPREVEVTARVATRDRSGAYRWATAEELALYIKPTDSTPTDGIVGTKAREIVGSRTAPVDKARAIYDWVVDSTFRNPKTRGCGNGDVKFMLETGDLGGKCADINSLYVALARAVGLPAREFFGVRVAASNVSKSLGKAGDITKAQHCRAEVYLDGQGWFPIDPADVRKVVLEEELKLEDPHVQAMRQRLFGNWEMNWVGFNYARDFKLAGQASDPVGFLMYPYAEVAGQPLDQLEPAQFRYTIESKELAV
jgi:transglutaminase-like putative cysteine protease